MNNAKWIGLKKGEDFPIKFEEYTKEKVQELKAKVNVDKRSLLFRKKFVVNGEILSAKLKISGLGFYEVFINGIKPDESRVLTPVTSDYFSLTRYDSYNVSSLIKLGENTLCAEVGPGWFVGSPKYWGWQQTWYGNHRLIACLTLEFANGKIERVYSDESWKISNGMITESCIYDGEKWDFNLYKGGWMNADFNDSSWLRAEEVNAPTTNLVESIVPPERIIRVLKPIKSWKLSNNIIIYDFGENGSAIPRVTIKGKKDDIVVLNHAEFIKEDGTLDYRSNSNALVQDTYILAGNEPTVCEVKFSWHCYRYMSITLSSQEIEVLKVEKCVVHTDLKQIGVFECGKEGFNNFHQGAIRTQLACLQGIPVDCPQREERKAWLGDAHVTAEMCYYNFDMRDFYKSFLEDLRVGRPDDSKVVTFLSPGAPYESTFVMYGDRKERTSIDWNLAYPIILNEYYQRYGDKELLKHHYDTLKEHTDYYVNLCEDGFIPFCWFGDWLTFDYPENTVNRVAFSVGPDYHRQNPPYAATMFFCATLRILIETARILGMNDDVEFYSKQLECSKKAICDKYYDAQTGILGGGGQFLQAYALSEHIVPEKDREKVFSRLVEALEERDCHLICGIFGYRVMCDVLNSFNRRDLIYRIMANEGYLCPQHFLEGGRTTFTESPDWDGSGCHCMWGSPDAALYKVFGGITIDRRREVAVEIRPYFVEEVGFVHCKQLIDEGEVSVDWEYTNEGIVININLPIKAIVSLPNAEQRVLDAGKYHFVLNK
ncbi:MAG: family 78 glycoside hydrolase catalytic domain [Clostridia bacterium]|nr:family 78 glycoside hydrolase catalytic domain [Clostridia bacterium]